MDSPRRSSFLPALNLFALAILSLRFTVVVNGSAVFRVKSKFGAGTPVADLIRHDELRHARRLSARPVDVHIGGSMDLALWFADIAIGTPPRHFQLAIDTGSPLLWVDCEGCIGCVKSTETVKLETYNPKLSKTARVVTPNESLCKVMQLNAEPENSSSEFCEFRIGYMEGSSSRGYYVTDLVSFDQVSSNPYTGLANVTFDCTTKKIGVHGNDPLEQGHEGIMGLGWTNHSILYQMSSTGRVRKEFAHCLDKEGGIFAFGHVVKPKVTGMTPLSLEMFKNHYGVIVTSIEVGVHSHIHRYKALVDTGSTGIIIPKAAADFALEKILIKHPNLKKEVLHDRMTVIHFSGSVDAEFPIIKFQLDMSHELKLYPHDYLIPYAGEKTKLIFGLLPGGGDMLVIGDVALRNKLFIYDLENKQLGWQDYNCSSSIELEDEGGVCTIGAHNITGHPK